MNVAFRGCQMRYSRNFRVFAGLVAFLAGVINFGIYWKI